MDVCVCVLDADAELQGAPTAPLDVVCQDANKDYVIVTWKQPAVDGGSSILGYFVDRSAPNVASARFKVKPQKSRVEANGAAGSMMVKGTVLMQQDYWFIPRL